LAKFLNVHSFDETILKYVLDDFNNLIVYQA